MKILKKGFKTFLKIRLYICGHPNPYTFEKRKLKETYYVLI